MTGRGYFSQKPITRTVLMKQTKLAARIAKAPMISIPRSQSCRRRKPRVKEQTKLWQLLRNGPFLRPAVVEDDVTVDAYAGDLFWGAPLPFWRASWLLTERLPMPDERNAKGSFSLCE